MVKVLVEQPEGQSLEATVEADLRQFEGWFMRLGNEPLVRSEVAILKTYLRFKTLTEEEKNNGAQEG